MSSDEKPNQTKSEVFVFRTETKKIKNRRRIFFPDKKWERNKNRKKVAVGLLVELTFLQTSTYLVKFFIFPLKSAIHPEMARIIIFLSTIMPWPGFKPTSV